MTDCLNIDVRDALPDYLHGTLDRAVYTHVQTHLDVCADCAAELRLLRAVLVTAPAPPVDVTRIVAAVPPYRTGAARRGWQGVVALRLAAAVLIAAIGISALTTMRQRRAGGVHGGIPRAAASAGVALVGVGELSNDGLEQLIAAMDHLEAAPPADPEPDLPAEAEGGV